MFGLAVMLEVVVAPRKAMEETLGAVLAPVRGESQSAVAPAPYWVKQVAAGQERMRELVVAAVRGEGFVAALVCLAKALVAAAAAALQVVESSVEFPKAARVVAIGEEGSHCALLAWTAAALAASQVVSAVAARGGLSGVAPAAMRAGEGPE